MRFTVARSSAVGHGLFLWVVKFIFNKPLFLSTQKLCYDFAKRYEHFFFCPKLHPDPLAKKVDVVRIRSGPPGTFIAPFLVLLGRGEDGPPSTFLHTSRGEIWIP